MPETDGEGGWDDDYGYNRRPNRENYERGFVSVGRGCYPSKSRGEIELASSYKNKDMYIIRLGEGIVGETLSFGFYIFGRKENTDIHIESLQEMKDIHAFLGEVIMEEEASKTPKKPSNRFTEIDVV